MVSLITGCTFLLLEAFFLKTTGAIGLLNITDVSVSAKYAPERATDGDWETFAESDIKMDPAIVFQFPESVLITRISFAMNVSSFLDVPTPGDIPSLVQCDFEDTSMCNFVPDPTCDFHWTRVFTCDFHWTRVSGQTPSSNTEPWFDHTHGLALGYYLNIEKSKPRNNTDAARLRTPSYIATNGHCIEWSYYMYGSTLNTLNVYVVDESNNDSILVWTKTNNHANNWIFEQVPVAFNGTYHTVFEGIGGDNFTGEIGLDDIMITDGTYVLDQNASLIQCDFEDESICSFAQLKSDDFDWTRAIETTPSLETDPPFNQSGEITSGYYMYIETSKPRNHTNAARIRTPSYSTTKGLCIEWFYRMNVNTLNVYVVDSTDDVSRVVWTETSNEENDWKFGQVSIATSGMNTYYIVFEGIAGSSDTGNIGLDDVRITDGECLVTPPVPIRVGSSINSKDNALCGNVTVGYINEYTLNNMSCVGKYLSFQANCANCSLQFYELDLQAITESHLIEYEGYYHNGNCHIILNEKVDWLKARTNCEAEGESSHLVTIDSQEENSFVFEIIRHEKISSIWIGLKKENSSIDWVDGEGNTFSNFNEENNEDTKACVSMSNDEAPTWNWENCTNSFKCICQKPASNRGINYKKYNSQKRITADRTAKKYDNVPSSGLCSLYCMSYTGCISFSFNSLTGECRLSDTIETNLADDDVANYFVQNHLLEKCNF